MCHHTDPYEPIRISWFMSAQGFCCRCLMWICFIHATEMVRLRKLQGGDVKGTFLAYAGLKRMSMEDDLGDDLGDEP